MEQHEIINSILFMLMNTIFPMNANLVLLGIIEKIIFLVSLDT